MVFYLKYRPETVSELDLESVRKSLEGVLRSHSQDKTPHALLFAGPRGSGKTSAARILAKAINCSKQSSVVSSQLSDNKEKKSNKKKLKTDNRKPTTEFEPCNECDVCKSVTAGRAMDVIEIDAASHRGIDDIRDLREKVKLAPSELKFKVYIIDEVHMLTNEAFNALLKTLEEPPKNVVFVLCTTELHKLPETIVSRCIKIPFHKGKVDDVMHALHRVVKGEDLKIDKSALRLIAEKVDGSFRDAHKMLEQLSWKVEDGKEIRVENVKELIGMSEERVSQIKELIIKKDCQGVVQLIEEMVENGENVRVVFESLLEELHEEYIKYQISPVLQKSTGQAKIKNTDQKLNMHEMSDLLRMINQALFEMKTSVIEQLPIELAIMEWQVAIGREEAVDKNYQEQEDKKFNYSEGVQKSRNLSSAEQLRENSVNSGSRFSTNHDEVKAAVSSSEDNSRIVNHGVGTGGPMSLGDLQQRWDDLLVALKPKNHSVQALLRSARPKIVDGNRIVVEVWYPFHFDKLNSHTLRGIVEDTICDVFGCSTIRLEYVLGQRAQQSGNVNTPRRNGNMISEDEVPDFFQPKNGSRVRDQGQSNYSTRRSRVPNGLVSEQDEALVKFAEEIFGN